MAPFILLVLLCLGSADAFAAGGFGGGGGKKKAVKSKKKKSVKKQTINLFTPEGRLEHIKSRVDAADFSPLSKLILKKLDDGQMALDIDPNGIVVIDNFLGNFTF